MDADIENLFIPVVMGKKKSPWYLPDGITADQVVGAYLAIGAPNYTQSKVNLVLPGTRNLAKKNTYEPDWNPTYGWLTNAQYCNLRMTYSGYDSAHTVLVRFSEFPSTANMFMGYHVTSSDYVMCTPKASNDSNKALFYNGTDAVKKVTTGITEGTIGFCGRYGVMNGLKATAAFNNLASPGGGTVFDFLFYVDDKITAVKVQAIAMWSVALSDAQLLQAHTNMMALPAGTTISNQVLLATGDSKAEGIISSFIASMRNKYGTNVWTYQAEGISGKDVAYYNTNIDAIMTDWAAGGTLANVTYITCNLGANDLSSGLIIESNHSAWVSKYQNVIDHFHEACPNAKVGLMQAWNQGYDAASLLLASWLPEVISGRSWAVIGPDENIILKGSDNGVSETVDGTHPTTASYAIEAAAWATIFGL